MRRLSGLRRGFTLVELLVALVLFGIVAGAIINLVAKQQRFYRGATEMIDTRTQLRQAASVLPSDLRGLSSISGDITMMTDTAVQFVTIFGSSVVCGRQNPGNPSAIIYLAPSDLARHTLTSWYDTPAAGDVAYMFDEKVDTSAVDDDWTGFTINGGGAPTPTAGLCTASPLRDAALDVAKQAYSMTVASAVPTTVKDGAVVRFGRQVRYSLYKPLNDTLWYLGYRKCPAGACETVQPISGPYRAWASGGATNGLGFTYYDSTGAKITGTTATDMKNVARIDVMLRGAGTEVKNKASYSAQKNNTTFQDSLLLRIAIRNRQ
jgi:prepilin-type N-terminal cleavage/methylation domain-containing protein